VGTGDVWIAEVDKAAFEITPLPLETQHTFTLKQRCNPGRGYEARESQRARLACRCLRPPLQLLLLQLLLSEGLNREGL
jgi:hypothetical protein